MKPNFTMAKLCEAGGLLCLEIVQKLQSWVFIQLEVDFG